MPLNFLAGGNVIILNEDDIILEVLRPVKQYDVVKGSKYIFNKVNLDLSYDGLLDNNLHDKELLYETEECVTNTYPKEEAKSKAYYLTARVTDTCSKDEASNKKLTSWKDKTKNKITSISGDADGMYIREEAESITSINGDTEGISSVKDNVKNNVTSINDDKKSRIPSINNDITSLDTASLEQSEGALDIVTQNRIKEAYISLLSPDLRKKRPVNKLNEQDEEFRESETIVSNLSEEEMNDLFADSNKEFNMNITKFNKDEKERIINSNNIESLDIVKSNLFNILPFDKEFTDMVFFDIQKIIAGKKSVPENINDYFNDLKFKIESIQDFWEITIDNGKISKLFCFPTIFSNIIYLSNEVNIPTTSNLDDSNILNNENNRNNFINSENSLINGNSLINNENNLINGNNLINESSLISNENRLINENTIQINENSSINNENNLINENTIPISENNLINENIKKYNILDNSIIDRFNTLSIFSTQDTLKAKNKDEIKTLINKKTKAIHFNSFNEAVDFYFNFNKKTVKRQEEKTVRIKKAQEKYIEELKVQRDENEEISNILERNRNMVQSILQVFRKCYDTKMDWSDFDLFYKQEMENENEIAMLIESYNLKERTCIVRLEDNTIMLKLDDNFNKNVERYYAKRKKVLEKAQKTKTALENIVGKIKTVKTQKREPFWFEKFHFFFSSDKQLVIGGKNAQQNEILVKKHLEKDDIYFHCDIHGGSSVISKGSKEGTIIEASYMALVMSKSWDDGIVNEVFYVNADQVLKTFGGEKQDKGTFIIKGKKNITYPHRLEYGMGLIFIIEGGENGSIPEFTCNPVDENILYAMPVSAPWGLIKTYKYRVRICPGKDKKSVVCGNAMKTFHLLSENSFERDFVMKVGLEEYMVVAPSNSKIGKISN